MTKTKNTSSNLSKTVKKNSIQNQNLRKNLKDKSSEVKVNKKNDWYIRFAYILFSIFSIIRIILIILL